MKYDVVVVGGGIAGLATCIHLSRMGFRVACVEPSRFPRSRLGESLDFAAPEYLSSLGISHRTILEKDIGKEKDGVRIQSRQEELLTIQPLSLHKRPPFNMATPTLHVDRYGLDLLLYERALSSGTTFFFERARKFIVENDRVLACELEAGELLSGDWFIDSSGRARVLAKALKVSKRTYGRKKVCLSTILPNLPSSSRWTTFHIDADHSDYLQWIWEIPISSNSVSVGLVCDASVIKARRRSGESVDDIFLNALSDFPRFAALPKSVRLNCGHTTAWTNYVSDRLCGENWLLAGEAAVLMDALTAHGVTSALRHAAAVASIIEQSKGKTALCARRRKTYEKTFRRFGAWLNNHIETVLYEGHVRRAVGLAWASRLYAAAPPLVNQLFLRYEPLTGVKRLQLVLWLTLARAWTIGCRQFANLKCRRSIESASLQIPHG